MEITATWSTREVVITIADDGPGVSPLVLDALGEPYITTRPAPHTPQSTDGAPSGMGLGFFIAKTLLERSGATVTLENRPAPASGAVAQVSWPRAVFEEPRTAAQTPAPAESCRRLSRIGDKGLGARRRSAIIGALRRHDVAEDLSFKPDELPQDRSLVLVDDDRAFVLRLAKAMEGRGFEVRTAHSVAEGLALIHAKAPAFAVVDMRLEDGNGLDVVAELAKVRPQARSIVLTGYGNIATAVTAVKLGAVDYLAKPADADDVTDALLAPHNEKAPPPENPCRPTACAGSTSSASTSCATATSRRRRAGSTCTAARCSGFSRSGHRSRPVPLSPLAGRGPG